VRIPTVRLDRQLITTPRFTTPAQVVAWLGAVQAQDYLAALWALGLRTPRATEATIEASLADGSVIRTHLFRGTWQLVAREDVRWMLGLVGDRLIASAAGRHRQLGLDGRTLGRCGDLFANALAGGRQLTRREMVDVLARGGIDTSDQRLSHILGYAELGGVICGGGRRGKQRTYALLDDRVPPSPAWSRDQALAELARRYFRSRGPATVRDFAWWSGLPLTDLRTAIALAGADLTAREIDGAAYWLADGRVASRRSPKAHLLPAFDELLVGYQDRSALVDPTHTRKINAGGGMLSPTVVLDGLVIGTWKRKLDDDAVTVAVSLFGKSSRTARAAIAEAADRYGTFLGLPTRLVGCR
jgi:hypothetical protein